MTTHLPSLLNRDRLQAPLVLIAIIVAGCHGQAATPPAANDQATSQGAASLAVDPKRIDQLIDQLVNVSEPGFGYSVFFSGWEFLPYDDAEEMGTMILGATRRARSNTLRRIVEAGADVVPVLLEHMEDDRRIRMEPVSGMDWIEFADEYDANRRSRPSVPLGIYRERAGVGQKHPDHHTLTVGDLCFVALGQIVNRHFSATRYQPTGGVIVSSPTYSDTLRTLIVDEWGGLTKQRHKELLIEDFVKPDHEFRRTGAYLRLAYYFPEAVEALVVEELSKPTSDFNSKRWPDAALASESERERFIDALTHDDSRKIGDAVREIFLKSPTDTYLAPACLRCLANRGYAEFLIELLKKIDTADSKGNLLHECYIEAVSHSSDPKVRDWLLELVKTTASDEYMMAALPAMDRSQDSLILDSARRILAGLPDDTDQGEEMLTMIGERFPDKAKSIFKSFLATGSANRAETMCKVFWYGHPLSRELLVPLLDDKRPLPGFSIPMRVCDRAAEAIGHTSKEISFNSEGSTKRKDQQIDFIKKFCQQNP